MSRRESPELSPMKSKTAGREVWPFARHEPRSCAAELRFLYIFFAFFFFFFAGFFSFASVAISATWMRPLVSED